MEINCDFVPLSKPIKNEHILHLPATEEYGPWRLFVISLAIGSRHNPHHHCYPLSNAPIDSLLFFLFKRLRKITSPFFAKEKKILGFSKSRKSDQFLKYANLLILWNFHHWNAEILKICWLRNEWNRNFLFTLRFAKSKTYLIEAI